MGFGHHHHDHNDAPGEDCLARSVAEALAEEPALEAVTIDAAQNKISVATLGRVNADELTQKISARIHSAKKSATSNGCLLLSGQNDCSTCHQPLSAAEKNRITIKRDGGVTTIARVTCPTAPKFWRWRDLPLRFEAKALELPLDDHDHDHPPDEWKLQMVAAVLCGVFGLLAAFAVPAPFKVWAFVAAYLAGAWFPAEEVWERLQQRVLDVHFLMLAVAIGAASIGAWAEGATLLFLFSFSGALEHYALGRTQKEIRSLFRDAPKTATLIDAGGNEKEVAVEKISAGMRLLIKPGAQFPVDAEIAKGTTAADESNLTGEATPAEKKVGDPVLAGTINLWGAVEVVVTKPASESSLQKIIKLIREAQQQKAPAQRFADKFSTYYTYGALGLSLTMFFVWWLGFHLAAFTSAAESHSAFYRTMTLLVVSSPCALVLSIPSAVLAAIAWSASHGILFRGGAAVEKLAEIKTVCLDKTGTLTTGELRVEKIESFPAGRENEIAQLAYSLEKLSTHPLARAITRHGKQLGLATLEFSKFESVTGQGLKAQYDGREIVLGKREWVAEQPLRPTAAGRAALLRGLELAGAVSQVWVVTDELVGCVVLRDDIRPQAKEVIEELRQAGLKFVVLTGDRQSAADYLKSELKLDDVRAGLKPEEKVAAIRELSADNKVAMVGDGVNDAPSLAAAYVGVAMGARGSDAALEQADVVLMHDRLENFLAAFRLSQRAAAIIKQNLFISLGAVVVLVCFALVGKIPLTIGVVGHEGSTVVVVMNSLRLLFGGGEKS
jgi:Cd2+/Zn2+-exporting ATPase